MGITTWHVAKARGCISLNRAQKTGGRIQCQEGISQKRRPILSKRDKPMSEIIERHVKKTF